MNIYTHSSEYRNDANPNNSTTFMLFEKTAYFDYI